VEELSILKERHRETNKELTSYQFSHIEQKKIIGVLNKAISTVLNDSKSIFGEDRERLEAALLRAKNPSR